MAAPVWESKGTDLTGASGTTAVVTLPTSLAANDLVIVAIYKENTAAVTPAAGFTEITGTGAPPQTTAPQKCHALWLRCAGGESGTVSFSWVGSVFRAASAHRVSGGTTAGSPIGEAVGNFNNSSAAPSPAVSTTGTGGDELLVWIGTNFAGGNAFGVASGFTERLDIDVLGLDTKANVGGAGSGSVTATSNVSGAQTAFLFSITSAPPPPQPTLWVNHNVRRLAIPPRRTR